MGLEFVEQIIAEKGRLLNLTPEEIPVPPPEIHSRVTGRPIAEDVYGRLSRELAASIEEVLAARSLRIDRFKSVLDFGCGCGRILINYVNLSGPTFYGTDIDEIAIGWCREHIPGMNFSVNDALPPLQWPDSQFDFIMAVSVFDHLPWKMQIDWLRELKRVLRPGGYLFASTLGDFCASEYLTGESLKTYRKGGYCYVRNIPAGFPEWYQTTFLSPAYVQRIFRQIFDDITHVPRGLHDYHDAVLLRKA